MEITKSYGVSEYERVTYELPDSYFERFLRERGYDSIEDTNPLELFEWCEANELLRPIYSWFGERDPIEPAVYSVIRSGENSNE